MNRYIGPILFILIGTTSGCIEEYYPEMDVNSGKMIIDGILTDQPGKQSVRLSMSSSISTPRFNPVTGCLVQVTDSDGKLFTYTETFDGIYHRQYEVNEVATGKGYTLHVITPEGKEYSSDLEVMADVPPVDTVYYREESIPSFGEDFNYEGVRFYVDIDASEKDTRFYAYQLSETWETYAPLSIEYVYDSARIMPPYDKLAGLNHCWIYSDIEKFFVTTTRDKAGNSLTSFPLHYVSSETSRLRYKYSLLVSQLSITEDAYEYYAALNNQSFETGGLYETQPRKLVGNICNSDDSLEHVMGYFVVSSVKQKRIFVEEAFKFIFHDYSWCSLSDLWYWEFRDMQSLWPIYLAGGDPKRGLYGYAQKSCFDCTFLGGVTDRPTFWDEEQ